MTKLTKRQGSNFILRKHKQETKTNKVFFYARVSTDDQELSLKSQKDQATNYAKLNNLEIVGMYMDEDSSAVKREFQKRPLVKQMLEHMEKKDVSTILIVNPDRIWRSTLDCCITIAEFNKLNRYFNFISLDIDLSTPMGMLTIQMVTAFAEWECNARAERQYNCYQQMRKDRIARNQYASYGWDIDEDNIHINKKGRTIRPLIVNIEEQKNLRFMKALREQEYSFELIANTLNEKGITTKNAGKIHTGAKACSSKWTRQKVDSVLNHIELATQEEIELANNPF